VILANQLSSDGALLAGQTILVPDANPPVSGGPSQVNAAQVIPPASAAVRGRANHVVTEGQTLAAIARIYGVPWTSIAEANGLSEPYALSVGQSLVVPGAEASPPR
jgi:LysM repeat protein